MTPASTAVTLPAGEDDMKHVKPHRMGDVEYFTVDQVAELLERDVQMVRRWIREGRLEAERLGPIYIVRPGAVRRFKVPVAKPRRTK